MDKKHIHLEVYDGPQTSNLSLLYKHDFVEGHHTDTDLRFTRQMLIDFNNHYWSLRFTQYGSGLFATEYTNVWFVMIGGTIISWLLFVLILTLIKSRDVAEKNAVTMNENNALKDKFFSI